ncbi:MAG: Ig-like domain-containing protein [Anaeromyxobacteraceae bacterium]
MHVHRSLAAVCVAFFVAACGGGGTGEQGGTVPPTGAARAVAPGDTGVPLDAPLVFTLPADVDPSSFSAANVTLRGQVNDGPQAWALDTSLDTTTRKLTVSPHRVLAAGTFYTLTLQDLKTTAGAAHAVELGFRSMLNPVLREYRPHDGPPPGFVLELGWRIEWARDAAGGALGSTRFYSKGADGRWVTGDDPVVGYSTVSGGTGPGATTLEELFDGAGADLTWHTPDDILRERVTSVRDAHGHVLRQLTQSRGNDHVLDTADDLFACVARVEDAQGRLTAEGVCSPGPDETYFTADDTLAVNTRWIRDANDEVSEQRFYVAGPDGIQGTADDQLYSVHTYTRTPGKVLDRFWGAGADGIFPSADDLPQAWDTDELDARGRVLRSSGYIGKGPDGKVGTDDDDVYYRTNFKYDTSGARTWSRFAHRGADGKIDTWDDDVEYEREYLTDR